MPRNTPPSRLRRAWLLLGLAGLAVLGWRLWPEAVPPGASGTLIALPEAPETLAPPPSPDADRAPSVAVPLPAAETPAPVPRVARAAPADEAAGGVRITLPGARIEDAVPVPATAAVAPAAPDPALTARTEAGVRPAAGASGRTPFSAYRRLQPVGEAPATAVLLGGLGLDEDLTRRAVALPPEVSLSFVPYARDVAEQMEAARAAGHEVLLELPMGRGGAGAQALGPAALSPERPPAGNERRLDWLFTRSPAYPMVTNYLGRGVTSETPLGAQIMRHAAQAGVAYIDDTGQLAEAARAAGVPYAAVDVLAGPDEADAALAQVSGEPGSVRLVKLYASPASLTALEGWTARAVLTPVSSKVSAP